MPGRIEFPPVLNGLDYVKSAVEHLRAEPGPRELKYAILHLQAGTEVLLKARLLREDWTLIAEAPDQVSEPAFARGDFKSISTDLAIARLKEFAGIDLGSRARRRIRRLAIVRNKLQHFGLEDQAIGIESLAGEVLDTLWDFIEAYLLPGSGNGERDALEETLGLIREETERISGLIKARERRIIPELDAQADRIVTCPSCKKFALVINTDFAKARCMVCAREWSATAAALEYAEWVLGLSWHTAISEGDEVPVHACPECHAEAFVRDVLFRSDQEKSRWTCFNCALTTDYDNLQRCMRCGELFQYSEEDGVICPSCWGEVARAD